MQQEGTVGERLLSIFEAATAAKLTDQTLRRHIKTGELKAEKEKYGWTYRYGIRLSDLKAWLDERAAKRDKGGKA